MSEEKQAPPTKTTATVQEANPMGAATNDLPPVTAVSNATLADVIQSATFEIHSPLPDEHPFYAKIGRVAAEWAQLEHLLDVMIWELVGGYQPALSCVTGQIMGAAPRLRTIRSLCETKGLSTELIRDLKRLEQPFFKTGLKRNRFIHDAWYIKDRDDNIVTQFRSQSHGGHGQKIIADDDVLEVIQEIKAQVFALGLLRGRMLDELSSSHKK